MDESIIQLKATESDHKTRLDKFLVSHLEDFSRERLKSLIEQGQILVEGKTTSPSHKIKAGENVQITLPKPVELSIEAQDIPLDVLFEDEHLIIINKPAGISVHPSGPIVTGTLVNALLHHCNDLSGIGGVERPGIVHRLDKGTSGVMVVAKNDKSHNALTTMFSERTMDRYYLAVCYGVPLTKPRKIETNIGRHPKDRKKMATLEHGGKHAITTYEIVENYGDEAALLKFKLHTGRTHQIRVHAQHIGHPLIGDPVYGKRRSLSNKSVNECIKQLSHQMLHATILGFKHPITGENLQFETPPPADMKKLISTLKSR